MRELIGKAGSHQDTSPLFVFVDLHPQYANQNKAFNQREFTRCIYNCYRVINFAREKGYAIAHCRQKENPWAPQYPDTELTEWLDELRPEHDEMLFERGMPSCYSNKVFSKILDQLEKPHIILLGLTGPNACLSTAIDAFHRNHDLTYLYDSSATPVIGNVLGQESHKILCEIINLYARVVSTREILKQYQPGALPY